MGALGLAIGRVEIEGRRRRCRSIGALISHRRPQSAGFRSATAGIEHGNRRIVGMERGAGARVTRDPLGQGLQERRHMTDPARHDGAVDLHPAARVNVGLAMQPETIAIFGDEDVAAQGVPSRWAVGRGACTTVSQARQLIFGRTCSTRLKCEGTYSRTMRSSAPIRPNFVAPQIGQTQGASCMTVSSGR